MCIYVCGYVCVWMCVCAWRGLFHGKSLSIADTLKDELCKTGQKNRVLNKHSFSLDSQNENLAKSWRISLGVGVTSSEHSLVKEDQTIIQFKYLADYMRLISISIRVENLLYLKTTNFKFNLLWKYTEHSLVTYGGPWLIQSNIKLVIRDMNPKEK